VTVYRAARVRDGASLAAAGRSPRSLAFFSRETWSVLVRLASASCCRGRLRSAGTLVSRFQGPRACTVRISPRAAMRSQILDAYQRTTSVGAIQTQRGGSATNLGLVVFIVDAEA